MDVKCPGTSLHPFLIVTSSPSPYAWCYDRLGCFAITTVFSHAQTVVLCAACTSVLCQPTGGKARLTEGTSSCLSIPYEYPILTPMVHHFQVAHTVGRTKGSHPSISVSFIAFSSILAILVFRTHCNVLSLCSSFFSVCHDTPPRTDIAAGYVCTPSVNITSFPLNPLPLAARNPECNKNRSPCNAMHVFSSLCSPPMAKSVPYDNLLCGSPPSDTCILPHAHRSAC